MERYTELKSKIVASISGDAIEEKNEATLSQSILEFSDILNTSDNAVSAARDDLNVLIPLFSKLVFSSSIRIRQASIPVFAKLQSIFTENPQLKKTNWWKEYKKSFEQNCRKLVELRDNGCADWTTIWCTLTRLLIGEIHSSVSLTNALCKIVEKSFKDKSENQDKEVQNGFNCWKTIVDCFTMSKESITERRVEFLLMPLKSPTIHFSKVICEAKLQTWLHTLSKISGISEKFIDIVLPPLIEFMFIGQKSSPAAFKFVSASRCADEFISILKMSDVFKRQGSLLIATTATCMETVKDDQQLLQIVWITALDAIKKHIENIGINDPMWVNVDALLTDLISVIDKLATNLPSTGTEFVDLMLMCVQGKCKILPLKFKFQMLIEMTMKPKNLTKLQYYIYNVVQAFLRLYIPKERIEKIFSVALDAIQVAATNTENNDEITNILNVLGEAWRAIVDSLIESIQWINVSVQFICPYFLFPLLKNGVKCDSKVLSSWKSLLSACMKTSNTNKKNIINELIKHFASLDTESYPTSLEVMNIINDMCESFDAIPYYSGVMDGLLKKSNSDSLNPVIQPLFESMLKYAKKNNKEASKLLEIANQLSNSKHNVQSSTARKNLFKFLNNMSMIENTTPEKSSKFLHRLAKAKEIQSQNNNRSPSSSPLGLFHLNSAEKKKSSPSVKTTRKTIDEESSQEFVMVPPKPKKTTVLTNHQKEKLSTRRCDIPALYQDLSQDTMSMDSILNAGDVVRQDRSILAKKNELNNKDEVIQSLCEDAIGFNCPKPASNEEVTIKGNDQNEDEEVIENTQALEKIGESKSDCHPTEQQQDCNSKEDSCSTQNKNEVVCESVSKKSEENVSDGPTKTTDEIITQKSDSLASETVSKVLSSEIVNDEHVVIQNEDTVAFPITQKIETEAADIQKSATDGDEVDKNQKIQNNVESDSTSVKGNMRTRKLTTPLRKSDRKNKNRVSPNKMQLLGKRRSMTTIGSYGSDVTKSPASSKRTKLQSRKSIAVVASNLNEVAKDVPKIIDKTCENVETFESKESSARDLSKIVQESCNNKETSVSKESSENSESNKSIETSHSTSQDGKSDSKQRKRALESTASSETKNVEEKSPTLKKRLRKSLGVPNDANSPAKVNKSRAANKRSKLQAEQKTSVDNGNNEKQLTESSKKEVSEVKSKNETAGIENSAKQAKSTATVQLEKSKEDLVTNSENVSDQNVSTAQPHAIEDKQTHKAPDKSFSSMNLTPKRKRLTPRVISKKKSPCSCCSEESYTPSRVKRKESLSRTLFEQLSPSQKNEKDADQLVKKEPNNGVLSELDCSQASSCNNTVLPSRKNEVLQPLEADKKPFVEIGSPILNDSEVIDIHISDKEKMEFENCTLIENGDEKENQDSNHSSKKLDTVESCNDEIVPDMKPTSNDIDTDKSRYEEVVPDIKPKTKVLDMNESLCKEINHDSKPKLCSDVSPSLPVSNNIEELRTTEEVVKDITKKDSSLIKTPAEENDSKNITEVQPSKNKHKGLDSWVIRSPRVDRNKDSNHESVTEENPEINESNLSNHVEAQGVSDSDESFIVSSQQPSDSVITIKRQSNSAVKKDIVVTCSNEINVLENSITSEESSKQVVETECAKEIDAETEKKSESLSKSHVCRRLLDNLENNKKENSILNQNHTENETECDLSFINDNVYCQVLSQDVTDASSHISVDHDYVSPSRNQNDKAKIYIPIDSNAASTSAEVTVSQSSNKSVDKAAVRIRNSVIDDETIANKCSNVNIDGPNKKNDSASSTSKNNCKEEKTTKLVLSSPDRSKILLSPSRAIRIKRMVLESAKGSPTKNEICDSPRTKTKVNLSNNFSSPEKESNMDELNKVISPPTAFKIKQSVSPEQSSNSKQKSNGMGSTSPSRALKIKRLIQDRTSADENIPNCSSPKKAAVSSLSKMPFENNMSSPSRTSRFEKQLSDCFMRSPEKPVSSDAQEKNGMEGNSSVTSSPQSARGRTAQLLGLVNGDSPAQFRRQQQTPKRIRPVRIITAPDSESHEGEDWVCKTYSPSAVPSPSILKARLKTEDVSPQSSPSVTKTKLSDDPNEISPPAKKKRVNFHDPPLTQKLFFFKTGSGKVVCQGKSSEPDPKSSVEDTVTDILATPAAPAESSCSSNTVVSSNISDIKPTHCDSSVDADSGLPSSSTSLQSLWNNVDEKEKLGFISDIISENKELLSNFLGSVSSDLKKILVNIMCNHPEFVSLMSKENTVRRCITQDIESLRDIICELDGESQLNLMRNIDESVKIKLLGDISPENKVSFLLDDLCAKPKLLKQVYNKIKVEDVAEEIASQLGTSSELGEMILEKADFDKVADLMISGINILKKKR